MSCHKLNETVYNKCEQILDERPTEKNDNRDTFYKSIYGPGTLMNDWYEKRIGEHTQETATEPPLSENMDSYRFPCKTSLPDRQEYFTKVFEGYGLGQELLLDHLGFTYYNNYATSYDLMFNHLNKGICGPYPRRYFKGHYLPETDLTNCYGNLTQWGLKEKILENPEQTSTQDSTKDSSTEKPSETSSQNSIKDSNGEKPSETPKKNSIKSPPREKPAESETISMFVQHDLNEVKKLNDFPNFKKVKAIY